VGRWGRAALVVALGLAACRDDAGSAEELCAALAGAEGLATVFAEFDPTDTETSLDQLRTARVELGELQEAAPSEVRDDLQVEIDYVQALVDGLATVPAGDPAAAAAMVQRVTDEHPDVQAAADQLEAYAADTC
jgi:hypothetical protein